MLVVGHKARLNARQNALLRRIADGAEPVTAREHTLAVTVYALRSRGLVTTPRVQGVWVAVITDAGRFYLEHDAYPLSPARSRRPQPGAVSGKASKPALDPVGLVARVQAAGGTLIIENPSAAKCAAWRASIQTAICAGHRLHYTGRLRGDLVITIEPRTAAGPTRNGAQRVRAVRRAPVGPLPRTKPHPLIVELRALLIATHAGVPGADRLDPRLPAVSRAALPRALRILQLLFTQAEQRGHTVRAVNRTDRRRTQGFDLIVHGHAYPITITEYHDVLMVKLDGLFGGRRAWGDGVRVGLEHKIGDILASLEERAQQAEQRRHAREHAAREHAKAQEAEYARHYAAYARDYATGILREQVAAWRLADDIRALCAQIREHIACGTAPAANHEWITWAHVHADLIDPATGPMTIPQIPPPTPAQLARYLDQQSTPAPEAHT